MDMDSMTALILTTVGIILLWLLIVRKRGDPNPRSQEIESASGAAGSRAYGAAWMKGRRPYMEDRFIASGVTLDVGAEENRQQKPASLFGVFDGHGGDRASAFCEREMKNLFDKANANSSATEENSDTDGDDSSDIRSDAETASSTLATAMRDLDLEFLKIARHQCLADGTTAVVALLHGDQLVVGNIGDSRAVLVTTDDDVVAMSDDHKPDRPDERKRIEALNGHVMMKGVYRVMGILAVSRAVGDLHLKKWVPGEPEMREERSLRRAKAHYLVIASDGLWDVVHNSEIPHLVSGVDRRGDGTLDTEAMARVLLERAYGRQSTDNITAVVVDLSS